MTLEADNRAAIRAIVQKWMLTEEGRDVLVDIHDRAYMNGLKDGYDTGWHAGFTKASSDIDASGAVDNGRDGYPSGSD